jgi:serine/threonine-protein kinase SRPK3
MELLDLFYTEGPNGTHEVLVTDVVCSINALADRNLVKPISRQISHQAFMGLAYLQEQGVVHGGTQNHMYSFNKKL